MKRESDGGWALVALVFELEVFLEVMSSIDLDLLLLEGVLLECLIIKML